MLATLVVSLALASTASADLGRVVAIGDSLASGTALGPAVGTYPRCGQTSGSYPRLASVRVKRSAFVDATCNGGHTGVFSNSWRGLNSTASDPLIPPQYNSLTGSEQVVIVGAGGNEAYFGEVMGNCMGHADDYNANRCMDTYGPSGAGLLTKTAGSKALIASALDTIHTKSPTAKVFLVGTPRIAPPDGAGCWPDPILTLADAPVWRVWEDSLRQAMIDNVATRSSWATFVDVQAASGTTHSMCAAPTMRWMNNWNPVIAPYPGLALHNTPWGADAIADLIVSSIKSTGLNTGTPNAPTLTRTSPTASPTGLTTQTFTYSGAGGSTFQCRLDNAAYAACPSSPVTLTGITNGPHTYSVKQIDAAGNSSPASIVNWTVDTVAPVAPDVTRTSPSASPTASPTQVITYSGNESDGTFQCKLDSGSWGACPSSPVTLSGLGTGSHTFSVTQTDSAQNVGAVRSVTWTVDTTPPNAPTVTRTSPSATTTNQTTQVLTYQGAEAGGTFQCKLDNQPAAACTGSPVTLTGLNAGTHTYSVTQTDDLGNTGSATTVTWTVDVTAPGTPTIARTTPTASPTNSSTQVITYSGAEAGGSFQCKLDNAAYAPCPSSPLTLTGLSGGSRAYSVIQTDAAGNASPPAAVSWTVDLTPPPTPSVSGPSGITALKTASIGYSNSEPGVTFQCKLDTAAYAPCAASPVQLTNLPDGAHTFYVTATDGSGNTSSPGTANWTVDPSGFTVSITANPSNPSAAPSASFSFVATITAGTSYQCKIDSGAFDSCSSPKSYSGLADGQHTFAARAVNNGQTTPEVSRTWVIDTSPPGAPTLSRTTPSASPTNSTSQSLAFTAAESGGVLTCKLDNAAASTCPSSPVTVTGLGDGSHTYTVTQTDAAGNTGSAATVTWVVDTATPSAPTVTRTSPTAAQTNATNQTISYGGLEIGATTQCKLDTAAYGPCASSPLTLTGLSEGSHTFSIKQTDAAGNSSEAGSVSWSVDSIAPSAPTLVRESPTVTPTNSATQSLAFAGAEAGGTLRCKLDNAAYTTCPASPHTLTGLGRADLASINHTFSVTQTDATGNTSAPTTVTWTVDVVAPAAPGVGSNRQGSTKFTSATIGYLAAESGGTMQCSMGSGAWSTCAASPIELTNLADDNYNYALRQVDAAGNIGAAYQVSWRVDTVAPDAPTLTRTSPATSPSNQTTASITISPAEISGTLQCKLDGAAWAACPSSPVQFSGLAMGPHTFSVTHTDAATNVSPVASVSWIIEPDTTPPGAPTVTRTAPTDNPTASNSQTITYEAAESGGTLRCKFDSAAYSVCSGNQITLGGLANGTHTFSVTQTDDSGNLSAAGSVTWTVDNIAPGAPTVTRTTPSANPTSSTSQTVTFAGAEPGGTFQCSLDSGAFAACPSSPVVLTGLGEGPHTYSVTQTDAAGNVGSATTVTWTVDPAAPNAPTVARTTPTANPTNSTSQRITYSGEPSGTFQCKLDAAAYANCPSSPINLSDLGNGTRNYSIRQVDGAGNIGEATTVTWTVDTIAPTAPTLARTNPTGSPTNSTTQTLTYGNLEAGASAQCKLDGGAFAPCAQSPVTLNALSSGAHTFTITQTDAAGNTSDPNSIAWVIDVSPPPAPNVSGPSGTSGLRTASISFSNSEAGVTFQCKLDSAAYAACPSNPVNLSGLADGPHTYSVTATDAAGNVSAAGTANWIVDPSGFSVSITSAPSNPTKLADASFAFVASITAGTTYECKLDGGAFASCAAPKNFSSLSDGSHTFTVRAVNGAQTTPETSRTWVIDTTAPGAPTVARTVPNISPTNSTSQSITFSGAESNGTFQCKLDSAAYASCPSSPITLSGLTNGSHTYSVIQTDAAGNVSAAGTVSWTIDNVGPAAPTVTRTSPSTSPTPLSTQTITYSGAEPGGTFQCKLDAGAWSPCPSSPVALSALSDGSHTYAVAQTDAVGNVGSASTVTWTVDASAPSAPNVTRTSPSVSPTNSTTQTISFSGESGGAFECRLDAAQFAACPSSPVTLTDLASGQHTYSVRQTDALGNVGSAATVTWTIDTTAPAAPTINRTSPIANPTNSTTQAISYGGIESGATTQCKLDAAASAPCSASPFTLSALSGGSHTVTITQTDVAGNTSAPASVSWVVDTTPPPAPNVSGPSGTSGLTTASVSYSNAESGVTFQCKLDSAAYAPCPPSPVQLTNLADGTHTYYVSATDAAGNVSSASSATWTVDPSGFTVSITSYPSGTSTAPTASFVFGASITSGTTYECKLDADEFDTCVSPKLYSSLPNGSHTFTVRAVNGTQVSPESSRTWVIDSTPPAAPTVQRTNPSATPTSSSSQAVSFVGAEPGGTLMCKVNVVDDSGYSTCPSSPYTLTGLGDGAYTLWVRQTDSVGNVGPAATVSWVVDTTSPAAPTVLRTAPAASPTSSTTQTISYAGEVGSSFDCKIDGGEYAPCAASPFTLTGIGLGEHVIAVRQTDAAGNNSPGVAVGWTVEAAVPTPPQTNPVDPPANPDAPITAKLSAISPKSIAPARAGRPFSTGSKRSAARFTVTLSRAATVRLRLEQAVVKKSARASTSWTSLKLKAGKTTIQLSGRSANRALAAGRYRVRLVVPGSTTEVLSKTFQIKR